MKLKPNRDRRTEEVINALREKVNAAEPALQFEFPGVLSDLIGDLTWSPNPVEIKIFSTDTLLLKTKAAQIARTIEKIPGVVDVNDGLVVAGPSMRLKTNMPEAARIGLTPRAQNCPDISSPIRQESVRNASLELVWLVRERICKHFVVQNSACS